MTPVASSFTSDADARTSTPGKILTAVKNGAKSQINKFVRYIESIDAVLKQTADMLKDNNTAVRLAAVSRLNDICSKKEYQGTVHASAPSDYLVNPTLIDMIKTAQVRSRGIGISPKSRITLAFNYLIGLDQKDKLQFRFGSTRFVNDKDMCELGSKHYQLCRGLKLVCAGVLHVKIDPSTGTAVLVPNPMSGRWVNLTDMASSMFTGQFSRGDVMLILDLYNMAMIRAYLETSHFVGNENVTVNDCTLKNIAEHFGFGRDENLCDADVFDEVRRCL
jgi:hypothetical protein